MNVRYYIDPQTGAPHIYGRDVSELEVEEVLEHAAEDHPGAQCSRVAIGFTFTDRTLRVVYAPDPEPNSVFVITASDLHGKPLLAYRGRRRRQHP